MSIRLTEEQQKVVEHPLGRHARVRAVAGSGKTSTMVARVKNLVECQGVNPKHIRVLMFNKLARHQFNEKLKAELPFELRPRVSTFHSLASTIINDAVNSGLLPPISNYWIKGDAEQVRRTVKKAIRNLSDKGSLVEDSVDPDDVLDCIGLWKASLIPPEHAGHYFNQNIKLVYAEFERLRLTEHAVTFDDFVPLAVGILESERQVSSRYVDRFDILIVDEYQDVNLSQQTLVQLLAANRADVMVVGDDDQTIYEWRGARPGYFTIDFRHVFSNKPTNDYELSTTFRFGPLLAQSAQNVIERNETRIPKAVIADDASAHTDIQVFTETSEQPSEVDKDLADQVVALVRVTNDPSNIIVLARLFLQLSGLEAQFLINGVPYKVIGQNPFFERRENAVLFNYLRLGMRLHNPIDEYTKELLLDIANVPYRKLTKPMLRQFVKDSPLSTLDEMLKFLGTDRESPASKSQREMVEDLHAALTALNESITDADPISAGEALRWLTRRFDLTTHYDNYYGKGESSEERKGAIRAICLFADQTRKNVPEFLDYLSTLDTTQGLPEDEVIVMTTVFREKGREYDYVFIPSCVQGMMPFLIGYSNTVFDEQAPDADPPSSSQLDNERRLFYVAITRARKAVFIGASAAPRLGRQGTSEPAVPSQFIEEMQLGATRGVIDAMQRFTGLPQSDMTQLVNACQAYAGLGSIVDNLVNHYLPKLRISLPDDVMQQLADTPKRPFEYSGKYKGATELGSHVTAPAKPSVPKWWERD